MWLSFCTTCHNRLGQLQAVWDSNLAVLVLHRDVQWVVLNYNSDDALHGFVVDQLEALPANFRYGREQSGRTWHASIAKNLAHRLATGGMLMNLDCDNHIADAVEQLRDARQQDRRLVHLWSGIYRDGTYGRIALDRDLFARLGGYDESFLPMGFQDRDLIGRAVAMGVPYCRRPCSGAAAVKNTKAQSSQHCGPGADWKQMDRANQQRSLANIRAGRLIANVAQTSRRNEIEVWTGGEPSSAMTCVTIT